MSLNVKELGWEQCSGGELTMIADIISKVYSEKSSLPLQEKLSELEYSYLQGMIQAFSLCGYTDIGAFDSEEIEKHDLENRFPDYHKVFGLNGTTIEFTSGNKAVVIWK